MSMSKLELLRDVKANGYRKIKLQDSKGRNRTVTLDSLTASAILAVHDNLRDDLKAKFLEWDYARMSDFAFKNVRIGG